FDNHLVSVADFLPRATFASLQKAATGGRPLRIHIPTHKRGEAISYHDLHICAPEFIAFYQSYELQDWCSWVLRTGVVPTPLNDLSSCSLLIYNRTHDHIRFHYDLNFYRGRHFTGLLSLVNSNADGTDLSSAKLIVRSPDGERIIPTPPNTFVLF